MIRLALALMLWAAPVSAQPDLRCAERDHLAGWLAHSHGLSLWSWGLSREGWMLELFTSGEGHFAVIETRPSGCSRVVSHPTQHRGRLWRPVPRKGAPAEAPPQGYVPGWPM